MQLTECLRNVEHNSNGLFQHNQMTEITASYFMLEEQHLHIEVWVVNKLYFNTYIGYESLRLMDIATGPVTQSVSICDKLERDALTKGK